MALLTKLSMRSVLLPLRNLKTPSRFQSTEAAADAPSNGRLRRSGALVTLSLPIVRTGNDKLQAFHEFLVNNVEKAGVEKEMVVYHNRLDEMVFKVGSVSLWHPPLDLNEGKFSLSKVSEALDVLVSRIRSLRNGASGPISVPFGSLSPRHALHLGAERFDAKHVRALMLNVRLGPEYALLESIIAVASLNLLSQGVLRPNIFKGKVHSPPPGTPQSVLISTRKLNPSPNNQSPNTEPPKNPTFNLESFYALEGFKEFLVKKDAKGTEELAKDGNLLNGVDLDLGTAEVPGFRIYCGTLGGGRQIVHEVLF
ncbi:hypothetical protein BU17DRAFT_82387 [Hysterangium stoloniferum]|nr:hypothetical protein BU17DRAFT_82387 [Hysterangium stoloniferum]